MTWLLIETATECAIVSFVNIGDVIYHRDLPFGLNNSAQLASVIDEGLKELQMKAHQLEGIAVGCGPGSYTGIRVAAAIGEAIAYAASVPLVGVCTLECFTSEAKEPFAVVIDAKISGCYLMLGGEKTPHICPLESIGEKLKGVKHILTPNGKRIKPKIDAIYGEGAWLWHEVPPSPYQMARRAQEKFHRGEVSKVGALDLIYLRGNNYDRAK